MLIRVCNRLVETASTDDFQGAYVAWLLEKRCAEAVHRWCRMSGVQSIEDPEEMHCTLAYSPEVGLDPSEHGDRPIPDWPRGYRVEGGSSRRGDVLGKNPGEGALVIRLDSPALHARHQYYRDVRGLPHGFPSYLPHVTVSYDAFGQDPAVRARVLSSPCPLPLLFDRERVAYCRR